LRLPDPHLADKALKSYGPAASDYLHASWHTRAVHRRGALSPIWLTTHEIAYRCDERYRILSVHAIRPDFYLPELDLYVEYWGMDTADYKFGMLKKQQL
jgi:hypothetical protein